MAISLNYEVLGTGKPIVILHGLLGAGRNLRALARKLADTYSVFLLDLRNHGNSPHAASMSYPEMASDVATIVSDIDSGPVNIIGHSMGGKVAMACALESLFDIEKLVVLDIAPVNYTGNFRDIINALAALPLERLDNRKQASEHLAADIPEANLRLFLMQNLVQGDSGFHWRVNLTAIRNSLGEIGGFPEYSAQHSFSGPTLFLGGAESEYIKFEHHEKIDRLFPAARIEQIANAGHWLHADQPEKVQQSILHFLE